MSVRLLWPILLFRGGGVGAPGRRYLYILFDLFFFSFLGRGLKAMKFIRGQKGVACGAHVRMIRLHEGSSLCFSSVHTRTTVGLPSVVLMTKPYWRGCLARYILWGYPSTYPSAWGYSGTKIYLLWGYPGTYPNAWGYPGTKHIRMLWGCSGAYSHAWGYPDTKYIYTRGTRVHTRVYNLGVPGYIPEYFEVYTLRVPG